MEAIDFLASDNYIIYNKSIAKEYGIEEAIVLGAMCGYQRGFGSGEFYRDEEQIAEDTGLTIYAIRKAKKTLQNAGILIITKKGMPARHYFKINTVMLFQRTSGNENTTTSGNENITTSGNENTTTNYNNKNNNKNNNKVYIEVVDYLNLKTGKKFRVDSKPTQKLINGRIAEGYTIDDFKKVIDNKVADWLNDDKFNQYLKPDTLFCPKHFESYLNQTRKKSYKDEQYENYDFKKIEEHYKKLEDDGLPF